MKVDSVVAVVDSEEVAHMVEEDSEVVDSVAEAHTVVEEDSAVVVHIALVEILEVAKEVLEVEAHHTEDSVEVLPTVVVVDLEEVTALMVVEVVVRSTLDHQEEVVEEHIKEVAVDQVTMEVQEVELGVITVVVVVPAMMEELVNMTGVHPPTEVVAQLDMLELLHNKELLPEAFRVINPNPKHIPLAEHKVTIEELSLVVLLSLIIKRTCKI